MAAERVGITPIVRTPGLRPGLHPAPSRHGGAGHPGAACLRPPRPRARRSRRCATRPRASAAWRPASRAADYGKIPLLDHMASSNREILLACMIEDMAAVERIDEIAAVDGVDLLAVGPSDLSRSLGVSGHPDHPRLVAAIDRVRDAVQEQCGVRLALPLNHAAFPRNAAQLKDLGAGYTNCAPTPKRACCARCKPSGGGAGAGEAARVRLYAASGAGKCLTVMASARAAPPAINRIATGAEASFQASDQTFDSRIAISGGIPHGR